MACVLRQRANKRKNESRCIVGTSLEFVKREEFVNVAEETLDSLPEEFRSRIQNVAILIEDFPPNQKPPNGRSKGGCFWAFSTECPQRRRASSIFRSRLPTSSFIRRISKRSVLARQKFVIKVVWIGAKALCASAEIAWSEFDGVLGDVLPVLLRPQLA